jgi:outer membrane protein TolC
MKKIPFILLLLPLFMFAAETYNLTIDDAVSLALERNEAVLTAQAKLKERRADKGVAFSSFLPSVDLQGTYTRLGRISEFTMLAAHDTIAPLPVYDTNGNIIGFTQPFLQTIGADTFSLPLSQHDNYVLRTTVKQTLFTGGKVLNAYNIARLNYGIGSEQLVKTVDSVQFNVIQSFYTALTAGEGVKLIRESYAQLERHVSQVQALYDNGIITKLDLLRAKVSLANLKTQMIRAENGLQLSRDGLKIAIGLKPEDEVDVSGSLEYVSYDVPQDSVLELAAAWRPELKMMKNVVSISRDVLNIEWASFSPNVFAALNYDYKNPVGMGSTGWGTDWNVTVGFTIPIFSGFSRANKIDQRKAQLKQAQYSLQLVEKGLELEVKVAFLNLKQEDEIFKFQEENRRTAEEAFKLADEQYKSGLITNLEYMDTQVALLGAKTEYLSSLSRYLIARAKIAQLTGEEKGDKND